MRRLVGALALVFLAAGLLQGEGAWILAAFPFAAYGALGVFLGTPHLRLRAERSLSSRFAPSGSEIEVRVAITNEGDRLECVSLADAVPEGLRLLEGAPQWRGSLDAGQRLELRYTVACPRGCHAFTAVHAIAEDPLTAMKTNTCLDAPLGLAIHPRIFTPPGIMFGAGAARPFSGRSRTRRQGTGTDFAGTRDYTPGDPLKCLNWRAEALWGRPIVNVFEEERAIDVGIILDCRSDAYVRQEVFETAVTAALSMAEDLLDRGNRVAFLRYGSLISWIPPGSGRDHRLRIRMATAQAALGAHAAFDRFDNLPPSIFPPRSLVLVVTPLKREDAAPLRSLRALGYEVAIVRPDPCDMAQAGEGLAHRILSLERRVLLARLLRARMTVLDWSQSHRMAGGCP